MISIVKPPYLVRRFYPTLTWNFNGAGKDVYLTFDDGPVPDITEFVLDELKKYNAAATFFCVGANVSKHEYIYNKILQQKHTVGNHTFSHLNGWRNTTTAYVNDAFKAAEVIHSSLFRPPYGRIRKQQATRLSEKFRIIMWDVLSYDFDKNTSSEKCLKNVTDNVRPGSIVVLHDSVKAEKNLKYALPRILAHLSENEFTFKSIPVK